MNAEEFFDNYTEPLRVRDGLHKQQIIKFAAAYAADAVAAERAQRKQVALAAYQVLGAAFGINGMAPRIFEWFYAAANSEQCPDTSSLFPVKPEEFKAVAAERERAAKIVDKKAENCRGVRYEQTLRNLAAAIRAQRTVEHCCECGAEGCDGTSTYCACHDTDIRAQGTPEPAIKKPVPYPFRRPSAPAKEPGR